jgi:hypothetical protein
MRRVLFALAFVLYAAPAFAQTNPVPAGQSFRVGWDADATGSTLNYQCSIDGTLLTMQLATAPRECTIPAQAAGVHTVMVRGLNNFGATNSDPLTVTAGTAPPKPGNLRIVTSTQVRVNEDGTVTLLASSTTLEPTEAQ